MKRPSNPPSRFSENIPELITHLWKLYFDMTLDPALAEPAERIRTAALELEDIRRTAFAVYREESIAARAPQNNRKPDEHDNQDDEAQQRLCDMLPISPLKQ